MKTIIRNNIHSLKNMLIEYGIKDITEIKHDHNFIFKATTLDSYLTIHTEPYDEAQKYIRVNSIIINLEKKELTPTEQRIFLYTASYGANLDIMREYLNSEMCADLYPASDIETFKKMFDSENLNNLFDTYWDLDTATRDSLIEIISTAFSIKL